MHTPLPTFLVASHNASPTADGVNVPAEQAVVPSDLNLCVTTPYHSAEAGAPIVGVLHEAAGACAILLPASLAVLGVLPLPQTLCNSDEGNEWLRFRTW